MIKGKVFVLTFAVVLLAGLSLCSATYGEKPASEPKLRIGTYEPYILALAYYKSDMFKTRVNELVSQIKAAEADGKTELHKKLNTEGMVLQRQKRAQLSGRAPVDNIVAQMKDALPEIAQASGVVAIAANLAYHSPDDVELLDITDAMVGQFNPSKETLRAIKTMTKQHEKYKTQK